MTFSTSDFAAIIAAVLAVPLTWINRYRVCRFLKANLTPCKLNTDKGFVVLVADLADDPGCTQTNHLVEALGKIGGFQVSTTARILSAEPVASDRGRELERLKEHAQSLLREFNADVLVWGKYYKDTFQLGFVPRERASTNDLRDGLTGYDIKPDFTIPLELTEHLRDILQMTILDHIKPSTNESGTYLVGKLLPLTQKIEKYLQNSTNYPEEQQSRVWHMLGVALNTIGEQTGDKSYLYKAIEAQGKATDATQRSSEPKKWANCKINMANTLARLGELDSDTKLLGEALETYGLALEEYSRTEEPRIWAIIQNNIGSTLHMIGERESGTKYLVDAVAAFKDALEVRTHERSPSDWAMTKDNLGSVLRSIGEREKGTATFEESVFAYKDALKVRTRKSTPLFWAATQNNLGGSLHRLGERMLSREIFKEAAHAYKEALKEYTKELLPSDLT